MNAVAKRPSVGSHCYCFPHWPIPLPEKNFGRKLNIARDARTNKQTTKLLAYPILSIPIVLPLSEKIYMKIKTIVLRNAYPRSAYQ